jgi:predicted nucleic acid-binding protein
MDFAVKHGLTAYDATYLELALRKNAILATLDNPLAAAARSKGPTVLPN